MLKYGNKEFRSLEEQVQKNKEDIANHYNIDRVLADFGIRVIGQITRVEDLPDPDTFTGSYGDAYAVGAQPPYAFYIWTRADVNAGHETDYWLNIGDLAIVGPQGPQGIQGPVGPQGEQGIGWINFNDVNDVPPLNNTAPLQTLAFNAGTGSVWVRVKINYTNMWIKMGNLIGPQGETGPQGPTGAQGPQGPQGVQGPRGDVGGFVNIRGILPAANQLPTPASLADLTAAYLVGAAEPYDLYIQIGTSSATAMWTNTGPLNTATLVYEDGEAQNIWDADTKVDTAAAASGWFVYGRKDAGNGDTAITMSPSAFVNSVPYRDNTGTFEVANATNDNHPTTYGQMKQYVGEREHKLYAHQIEIILKDGEALSREGYNVRNFKLRTTLYNTTPTPFTFDQIYYGFPGAVHGIVNTMPWTGEFNYDFFTAGSKLSKIVQWRRSPESSSYRLSLVAIRLIAPADPFVITLDADVLSATDTVADFDV